ncbi:MFS transporter [Cryptosporangium arvum]|uniref:MFS transporter n=1 Tax=Cryptosporangium arvum DSM 44712 TaxID=927661 RepID=A0A010ZV56_9ACTN|nr:MFS transporter [Cryptosporangium arvum]EXG81092.1 MFS transporter [Cryptosporangium arvum DSM 44712]
MTPTEERATYTQVLAQPVFRTVFVTRTLGITADTLRVVALSTLVFASTGSPLLAAVAFGVGFVPQAVGAVGLGALADRVPARALIVTGYLVEAGAGLAIALLHPPVVVILLLVGGVALFTPVFTGAGNRLIADVLTGDAYVLSRSLAVVASSVAQLVGLAVGAATVAALSPTGALFATAAAHGLAAAWSALGLPAPTPPTPAPPRAGPAATTTDAPAPAPAPPPTASAPNAPVGDSGPGSGVGESWAGTRVLLADRRVRTLLLAHWLPPAVTTGAEALLIPYAERAHYPAGTGGLLLACSPIGMLLGNLAVGRLLGPAARERLVIALIGLSGAPLLVFAADPPVLVGALCLVLTGAGYAYALGLQRRFLDAVPEMRRGQAFGLLHAGMMTCQGLGPALLGLLTESVAVGTAIALAGVLTLTLAAALTPAVRRTAPSPL